MSEEARDDDNASSEKGRDGIFMEHYHSRTKKEEEAEARRRSLPCA